MKKLSIILICTFGTIVNIVWTIANMHAKQTELIYIKTEFAQLKESNMELKVEMAIIKNLIRTKLEADETSQPDQSLHEADQLAQSSDSPKNAPVAYPPSHRIPSAEDPIQKIQQREDFAEFMGYVNRLEYTNGCDSHPIMRELKNNKKLQQYAWAISHVCIPKTFFGWDRNGKPINNLNANMNEKQDDFINSLPAEYNFSTLKEVKQEADRILKKLQKLK